MLRLSEKYKKEVIPTMIEKFGYKSSMAVPRIEKVVINSCFGKLISAKTSQEAKKFQENILGDLSSISGQKPILIKAKKSISGFKLRKGMPISAIVTLRKKRMYDFLERLIYITFPRSRDFRGISSNSIDKSGNLTIGIKEHITFPEVSTEKEKNIFGLEITVVTTAKTKEKSLELLKLLGFPIKTENN